MPSCTVSGVTLDFLDNLLADVPIWVSQAVGVGLITGGPQQLAATSEADGSFSFTVPQSSTVTVKGSFYVNGTAFHNGVTLTIPASATALLKDLAAVASFPSEGAVVQSNGTALTDLIGTFNFIGLTVELTGTGVARITSVALTDEQIQDALATLFPDSAPYDWTYDDAGNRVALVIAAATTLVNGLLSAGDKTLLDALGPRNAANGYAGLNGSGLLTESQIPSSIARDSETTAAIDAEAAIRAAADALLAPKASPALTGTPTAPTPVNATDTTQIATTQFVHALITAILNSAPANLDTLGEIAAALEDSEDELAALITTVSGKLAKASNLSDLVDAAAARTNLGVPAGSGTSTGTNTGDQIISDAAITTTDIATNDASAAKHGWLKKLSNVATEILDGQGAWRTIAAILGYTPANAAALGAASATSLVASGDITGANLIANANMRIANAQYIFWLTRSIIKSPADGVILLQNNAESGFTRVQLGGTSNLFPAWERSAAIVQGKLADGSDFCPVQGKLRSHANATAETPTATHTLRLFDAAGTEYKVLCVVA